MKAYSYLRFSTPDQSKGDSYRRQSVLAEAYCAEHDLELDSSFKYEDLGVSAFRGTNATKGALWLFKRAVEDGLVETGSYLLVESLDRVSRAVPRRAIKILEDLVDLGITVVTLSDRKAYDKESLDRDPIGFLMAVLVFMRSHEESKIKASRLKASWSAKRDAWSKGSGKALTSSVPAWLEVNEQGRIAPIQDRAKVVQEVFNLALQGLGKYAIAKQLNKSGVGVWCRSKEWTGSYISKILGNRGVVGDLVTRTVLEDGRREEGEVLRGYYPAVVSEETFNRVQGMKAGLRTPSEGRPIQNVLAGLAKCSRCGSTMTRLMKGNKKGGAPYLVCTKAKVGVCNYKAVKLPQLEFVLGSAVDHLEAFILESTLSEKLGEEIEVLELELEILQDQIEATVASLAISKGSKALVTKLEKLEADLELKKTVLASLIIQRSSNMPQLIKRQLERLKKATGASELNASLRELLDKVVIGLDDGHIHLHRGGKVLSLIYDWGVSSS